MQLGNPAGGTADVTDYATLDNTFADFACQYEMSNGRQQSLRTTNVTLAARHTSRNPMDTPRSTACLVLAENESCYLLGGKPH